MNLFVRNDVERIFRFRAEVLAEQFGGGPSDLALEWTEMSRQNADAAPVG